MGLSQSSVLSALGAAFRAPTTALVTASLTLVLSSSSCRVGNGDEQHQLLYESYRKQCFALTQALISRCVYFHVRGSRTSLIVSRKNLDSHQLDPGVHTDGDRIHRFHKVPPMSGDIKHLKDREINKGINLRRRQFHRPAARWQQSSFIMTSLSVIDSQQHHSWPAGGFTCL